VARDSGIRRTRRLLDVAGAAIAALLAFTAVPAVLLLVVGNPLASGLGHAWRPLPRDLLCLLVLAAWVAWAACCAQLIRGVTAHVRSGEVGVLRGAPVMDRLAARIAFGVLTLTTVGAPLSLSTGAGASTPAGVAPRSAITGTLTVGAPKSPGEAAAATYVVRPGEGLWEIADDRLGDGADWMALAALNLGRDMGGGTRFVDPDQLRAGWRLRLPAEARRPGEPAAPADRSDHPTHPQPAGHLPELVALGLGSLACAALARRARQRHRIGDRFTDTSITGPEPSEGALDAAALLNRFAGVPALRSFESANCRLGLSLEGRAGPSVRAICVSPSGVTFWFADAYPDTPPDPFTRLPDGAAWHVDHSALDDHDDPLFPYVPVVLPIGDNAEGTWLIPLEQGDVLPILGEAAADLRRAAMVAVSSWAWADTILVTEDPREPALRAEIAADPRVARRVLFCGDPRALPPEAAARSAVISLDPVAASDLTVLVDRRGATLHPMGRVVRPHLQTDATSRHIEELVTPDLHEALEPWRDEDEERMPVPAGGVSAGGVSAGGVSAGAVPAGAVSAGAVSADGVSADGVSALAPGAVEVRLLALTPRLDGLREELAPNRARRAVELVAYLALHQPDVITSDRLRTRVLGSSDADAASKTLFNTAYAARRAMGPDEHGDPLFPAGNRHGLYQLSPRVTVDVQRAVALAAEARAQSDPAMAIAYFRAALVLVEGEPLANALSGYGWWEAEGHAGRIAAVLVDAACRLASLAADAELFDLGRWGVEQARIVEPYSEALSRSAMQLAAAEGDADRLRLEWRECQRRVDTLDPGSSPSARTESLYGELSRRTLAGAVGPEGATAR
jgi:DNA-binding SARP family transcriptional activator